MLESRQLLGNVSHRKCTDRKPGRKNRAVIQAIERVASLFVVHYRLTIKNPMFESSEPLRFAPSKRQCQVRSRNRFGRESIADFGNGWWQVSRRRQGLACGAVLDLLSKWGEVFRYRVKLEGELRLVK